MREVLFLLGALQFIWIQQLILLIFQRNLLLAGT